MVSVSTAGLEKSALERENEAPGVKAAAGARRRKAEESFMVMSSRVYDDRKAKANTMRTI